MQLNQNQQWWSGRPLNNHVMDPCDEKSNEEEQLSVEKNSNLKRKYPCKNFNTTFEINTTTHAINVIRGFKESEAKHSKTNGDGDGDIQSGNGDGGAEHTIELQPGTVEHLYAELKQRGFEVHGTTSSPMAAYFADLPFNNNLRRGQEPGFRKL